jgi:predicted Ser/Thr protein kinase
VECKKLTLRKEQGSFDEGAYGTVFFFPEHNKAIKVYLKHRDADADHSRKTFASETTALKIANASEELRGLVPKYCGLVEVEKILDENGTDITEKYLTDLSFGMEFIEGHFQKLGGARGDEYNRIVDLFAKEKIYYVKDACAIFEGEKVTKIIDFGMEEIELWHKD